MGSLAERPLRALHIIGGGSRNDLLNQMIADATGLPVVAGPEEATAIGNALLQAKATGALKHLADAATIVRNSFDLREFTPRDDPSWFDARRRFARFVE